MHGSGKKKAGGREDIFFPNMRGNGGRSILHPKLSSNVQGLNAQKATKTPEYLGAGVCQSSVRVTKPDPGSQA